MDSLLGADLRIHGTVETTGSVRILGSVEGPIKARYVWIGPGGIVTGSLVADRTNIEGAVVGDIYADQIRIGSNGQIRGQVRYGSLESLVGARVQAHCSPRCEIAPNFLAQRNLIA
jgi:cytoskeletal protein CcmA (bactofilin family)